MDWRDRYLFGTKSIARALGVSVPVARKILAEDEYDVGAKLEQGRWVVSRANLEAWRGLTHTATEVARCLGVSVATAAKILREESELGAAKRHGKWTVSRWALWRWVESARGRARLAEARRRADALRK